MTKRAIRCSMGRATAVPRGTHAFEFEERFDVSAAAHRSSVTINLETDHGRSIFEEPRGPDVLLENFAPAAARADGRPV
jgi:crotonobetainyl-CoA:carnitine CoA-transferase CaiB-like acyl-CoA transferase